MVEINPHTFVSVRLTETGMEALEESKYTEACRNDLVGLGYRFHPETPVAVGHCALMRFNNLIAVFGDFMGTKDSPLVDGKITIHGDLAPGDWVSARDDA